MRPPARVVLLAGPSGAGKSRLADRSGLPVLRLDDFYKDGDDPSLPRDPDLGIVDWDHPAAWDADRALAALEALCHTGCADVPVYEISRDGRVGHRLLELHGSPLLAAEGIFAAEIVAEVHRRGLLAEALCVRHYPLVTFWRRLVRDLRERRKPPAVLLRRGLALLRAERRLVLHMVRLGCVPVTPHEGARRIHALRQGAARVESGSAPEAARPGRGAP